MVILKKDTISMFETHPEFLCAWMHTLNEMREVLISMFIHHDIHGWQGLKSALSKLNYEFEVKDLIVFYSRYEVSEVLIETLQDFSLKLYKSS